MTHAQDSCASFYYKVLEQSSPYKTPLSSALTF